MQSFQNDILQRQREFEQKVNFSPFRGNGPRSTNHSCTDFFFPLCSQEMEMQSLEKHVNFENENSRKAYYREFKKVHSGLIQMVYEYDFRDLV